MSSRNKNDVKKVFEFWCEVAPTVGVDRSTRIGAAAPTGIIVESYPENFRDQKTLTDVPTFAFPCDLENESVQSYSFVLTTDDSKWRFGFCRHDPKTNTAMVIITYLPWHDTFLRLLPVLAELRRNDNKEFCAFLSEAYNSSVPDLGSNLKIMYNSGQSYFVFERPKQFQLPSIPGNHNLNLYYNFVDPKNMIAVFAAMLAERRIIFTSRRLDRLSSCIQAANAFLYPMVWQHIFIPLLPMKLKDYLSAPMPYLIGVPEPVLNTMTPDELGEVVILNCDTKIFSSPYDDVHILPTEIVSQLKKHLSQSNEHVGDRVSKIFLGALVQLIGGYRDAVEFRDTGKTFNRDKFIESRPAHLRPFLSKMMELQIFQQFVDERLEMLNTGLGLSDEFEMETVRYAEKMKKRGRNYAFLKNVKDKTNPAVKSAVKSVKESSRGVKTAYKDLKSKFRDITPPNSTHFHLNWRSNSPQHLDRPDGCYGKATTVVGHFSAPSSPVFSKRIGGDIAHTETINGSVQTFRRAPTPLAMSNSITHIQQNGYAHSTPITNHLAASPAVSPASSLCSSEMNLSQELQNHPLFKSPVVDRSLKPSNSLDLSTRFAHCARSALNNNQTPPARPPLPSTTFGLQISPVCYYNHPYTSHKTHSHVDSKPPIAPRATVSSTSTLTSFSPAPTPTHKLLITTNSSYDNPPEGLSPPIPPRRNAIAATATAVCVGINCLERNCWQDPSVHKQNGTLPLRDKSSLSSSSNNSSSSSCSTASFVTAASTFSHLNNSPLNGTEPPLPAPRFKKEHCLQPQHLNTYQETSTNESAPSPDDTINDLISLDDSQNASFDLEDFDPLNKNARPLPSLNKTFNKKKSTTLPAGIAPVTNLLATSSVNSVSNPLYPYFKPQHTINVVKPPPLPKSKPPPMPPPDDDFELLRKYGLDQFTLATTDQTATTNTGNTMNNWTTFD